MAGNSPSSGARTPSWVKVFGIIALVLVLFVGLHRLLMGGRMMDMHGGGSRPATADAVQHGHRQP
jgi:hypothetical protein